VADSAGTELARSDTQRYNRTAPVWLGNNYGKGTYVVSVAESDFSAARAEFALDKK
jgi:hypothetical protein